MNYGYYTLDVFTNQRFGGNPLAVFPQAEGIDGATMQQIARELNLSETVFVGDPVAENQFPIRIFTPASELPFAGHPTVGTAFLLAKLGLATGEQLVLKEGVGDVPVEVSLHQGFARFKVAQLPEVSESHLTEQDVADLLGINKEAVVRKPIVSSCGIPFQMLELADQETVDQAELNLGVWKERCPDKSLSDLYLFSQKEGGQLYTRMFGPAFGIPEDPATGSAAAALTGALALEAVQQNFKHEVLTFMVEQGVRMGRPSRIECGATFNDGVVTELSVAGQSVLISEGRFLL
ncbi:PhzF family phenazine biosynthesis protein [Pontibacterium sp.]|uniref:PhzF family phenazine biosynthesis protein n=1 Tax=Pontibacterium sp. TaxID=2036026 RepID=UPI0035167644